MIGCDIMQTLRLMYLSLYSHFSIQRQETLIQTTPGNCLITGIDPKSICPFPQLLSSFNMLHTLVHFTCV